ncbi:hypothetical protein MesoLjLc_52480 [Mesorhizobium sp. L-8-10]|uniref:hypothetical protein n=1 Tax=Mesorhizobium sp. L-8-10 TaxID=2744523 RepID=UPI0019262B30|nr:hypothetical protein [Mesorhizobium sp. L-8-10]BCH33318.1 hypothetical protein MesoLjLc_52480 [Mesorhizobium sp. L-8-10]
MTVKIKRRTEGRAEDRETLDEQLAEGLRDTFPASDPVSVVSTLIAGGGKKLTGTDEILRRRRKEAARRGGGRRK